MAGPICWPVATSHRRRVLPDQGQDVRLVFRQHGVPDGAIMFHGRSNLLAGGDVHSRSVLSLDQDRMCCSSFVSKAPLTGAPCCIWCDGVEPT
jgi:hypothetical protein